MKKTILSLILALTFVFLCAIPVSADSIVAPNERYTMISNEDGSTVYLFSDGSKLTIGPIVVTEPREQYAERGIRYADLSADYQDANGNREWLYTLSATFAFQYGISSSCLTASYSQTIYVNDWTFSNGSATHTGAVARGLGKFVRKLLFITLNDIDIDISMTCDMYGNVT